MTKLTREQLDDGEKLVRDYLAALKRYGEGRVSLIDYGMPIIEWMQQFGGEHEVILILIAQARRALDYEEREERIKNSCALCSGTGQRPLDTPMGPYTEPCDQCGATDDRRKRSRE